MLNLHHKKGQSTVEYILLVTAVIAVIIVFVTNRNAGLQQHLSATLEQTGTTIEGMSTRLETSQAPSQHQDTPAAPVGIDVLVNRE